MMKDKKTIWAWVGAGVVVVIIIVAIIWRVTSGNVPATTSGPAPVYAAQGQLVPQFPKALILDTAAAVSQSYTIAYSSSLNQYSAEYNSSTSMPVLYNDYKTYFSGNGYTITGSIINHATFKEISASQGTSQVQVVVGQVGNGSVVTISYSTD